MDLERRVEALEKELQILKAQIQTTLLDIQEQILTNAYPTLRAENAAPERPVAPAAAPITILSANPEAAAQPAHVAQSPADEDTGLKVRKVTLNNLDDLPAELPAREQPARREPSVQAVQDLDMTALSRLEDWATEKLEHMGVARTKQLIRMYAEQGRFSPDVEATLLKFVSIYEETTGPLPSQPTRSNGSRKSAPTSRMPASRSSAPHSDPAQSEPPRRKQSPAASNNPAIKTIPADPTPRKQASGKPEAKASPVPPPTQPAQPPNPGAGDDDDQASVVLKLIAGIHNAGAGVKWRKKEDESE